MMTIDDFYEIWNAMHCKIVASPDRVKRNEIMVKWLEEQIVAAKKAYYNSDSPIMEDRAYDKIEEYLQMLDPTNKLLEKVGYDIETD